jgi:PIN domain nuclease of toxin-antitoxin system
LKTLFTDTSAILSVIFMETGYEKAAHLFREADRIYAAGLLEAEVLSAAARKGLPHDEVDRVLTRVTLIQPDRPLTQELKTIISSGKLLKGADLWHLACALYLTGDPSVMPFMTLDEAQAGAAARLGFKVLPEYLKIENSARETHAVYRTKKITARARKKRKKR